MFPVHVLRRSRHLRVQGLLRPFTHELLHDTPLLHHVTAVGHYRHSWTPSNRHQTTATAETDENHALKDESTQGLERVDRQERRAGRRSQTSSQDRNKSWYRNSVEATRPSDCSKSSAVDGSSVQRISPGKSNNHEGDQVQGASRNALHTSQSTSSDSSAITPAKAFKQEDILIDLDDSNDPFAGSHGFWPNQTAKAGADEARTTGEDTANLSAERHKTDSISRAWLPHALMSQPLAHKVDLSSFNPVKAWRVEESKEFLASLSSDFRTTSTTPVRGMVVDYMQNIHPWLEEIELAGIGERESRTLDEALLRVFDANAVEFLDHRGYEATDVVAWAWILDAESADRAVKRYLKWAQASEERSRPKMPLAIPLQILRAPELSISKPAFDTFLESIRKSSQQAAADFFNDSAETEDDSPPLEVLVEAPTSYNATRGVWDVTSAMLLIVRLLRHTRATSPAKYPEVASLACLVLLPYYKNQHLRQRLTFMANRLLNLIALPPKRYPFRTMLDQQRAQIQLIQHMVATTPQIPITREGYRALVKVQLVHKKTEEERAWAMAKGQAWPPWRHDQTGMDERREFPGKESRASRLLRRMSEAGFTHQEWEHRAAVLAGWDTDQTPTIQTRSVLPTNGTSFGNFFTPLLKSEVEDDVELWSTRVEATRTVREAWACFLTYRAHKAEIKSERSSLSVYGAMFEKLFSELETIAKLGDETSLPGDGLETFLDPPSPSEFVYVETEPPSVEGLYQMMISDGVKPGGHVLARLIENASSMQQGFQYLQDSALDEVKKDVLRHCFNYEAPFVRLKVSETMRSVFAAWIGLLGRSHEEPSFELRFKMSWIQHFPWRSMVKDPQNYMVYLLRKSGEERTLVWNKALESIATRLTKDWNALSWGERMSRATFWTIQRMNVVVWYMKSAKIRPDLMTFKIVASTQRQCMMPPVFGHVAHRALSSIKDLFAQSVYDDSESTWSALNSSAALSNTPDPEDILVLIEILGLSGDLEGLLKVVKWMHAHAAELQSRIEERQSGPRMMRSVLIVVRMFLEGSLSPASDTGDAAKATAEQLSHATDWCSDFGWPSDEEVKDFMASRTGYVQTLRRINRIRRQKEASRKEKDETSNLADSVDS